MLITDQPMSSIISVQAHEWETLTGELNYSITLNTDEQSIMLDPKEAVFLANLILKTVASVAETSDKQTEEKPNSSEKKIEELVAKLKACRFISDLYKAD